MAPSTYDVYMVDTPKDNDDTPGKDNGRPSDEPPKCLRQRRRSKARRSHASNTDTGENATPDNADYLGNPSADEQPQNDHEEHEDPLDLEYLDDSEDNNYLPPSEEEVATS